MTSQAFDPFTHDDRLLDVLADRRYIGSDPAAVLLQGLALASDRPLTSPRRRVRRGGWRVAGASLATMAFVSASATLAAALNDTYGSVNPDSASYAVRRPAEVGAPGASGAGPSSSLGFDAAAPVWVTDPRALTVPVSTSVHDNDDIYASGTTVEAFARPAPASGADASTASGSAALATSWTGASAQPVTDPVDRTPVGTVQATPTGPTAGSTQAAQPAKANGSEHVTASDGATGSGQTTGAGHDNGTRPAQANAHASDTPGPDTGSAQSTGSGPDATAGAGLAMPAGQGGPVDRSDPKAADEHPDGRTSDPAPVAVPADAPAAPR